MRVREIGAVSLMLFAMFFGAGNMIFPPTLGAAAGENMGLAMFGFVMGDAGLAVLAIAAVTVVGSSLGRFGEIVGKKFALVFAMTIYLLIGPMFALPRTGSVAFEFAVAPFLKGGSATIPLLIFTLVFFGATYFLSRNPYRVVTIVGKILTPMLLVAIALIFVSTIFQPYGSVGSATGAYAENAFFAGFLEGYNALDCPAGLAFAMIVINAIRNYGVHDTRQVAKYTVISGIIAGVLLAIVYYALAYLGALSVTLGSFENGGQLLTAVAQTTLGRFGVLILGITVMLACLTTAIGLVTSFSEYIEEEFPRFSYRSVAIVTTIFSFAIANVGLNTLISISLPIFVLIYPVTIVLIVLAFFKNIIGERRGVYWMSLAFAFAVSVVESLESLGISMGIAGVWIEMLPWHSIGIGWIVPALIGCIIGWFLPIGRRRI